MKDLEFILQSVRRQEHQPHLINLANRTALANYYRMAKEVAREAGPGPILDWGCGYGHMTFLLRSLGRDVVSYDINRPADASLIAPFANIEVTVGSDPTKLPFTDDSLGSVLSCGVLEHVPSPNESLRELSRILRTNGTLFIYMLPNVYSWTEWISRLRGISVHPVRYTPSSIRRLLEPSGFYARRIRKSNSLPKNLTGLPSVFRKVYDNAPGAVNLMDSVISRIPVVNLFSGVLEVIAVRG